MIYLTAIQMTVYKLSDSYNIDSVSVHSMHDQHFPMHQTCGPADTHQKLAKPEWFSKYCPDPPRFVGGLLCGDQHLRFQKLGFMQSS